MKIQKALILIMLVISLESAATAQYCNSFSMRKDMVLSYQYFDSKDNVTGSSTTICNDVITSKSGKVIYKVNITINDAKDEYLSFWEYEMKCQDGKFTVSMGSFTDPELMKEYDDLDIYIDTTGMEYPASLAVGQTLPDASFTVSKAEIGAVMKTYDANITNRKVISKEKVTVPAGTFECFKITYDMSIKSLLKQKYQVVEYIAEGVGKVKTETFNKKRKLVTSSLLTELKK